MYIIVIIKFYNFFQPNIALDFPANLNGQEPETILKLAIKLNAKIECDPILHSSTEISTGGKKISFEIYDDILIGLKMWARDHNKNHLTMFTECLRFWFIPAKDAPPTPASLEREALIGKISF